MHHMKSFLSSFYHRCFIVIFIILHEDLNLKIILNLNKFPVIWEGKMFLKNMVVAGKAWYNDKCAVIFYDH